MWTVNFCPDYAKSVLCVCVCAHFNVSFILSGRKHDDGSQCDPGGGFLISATTLSTICPYLKTCAEGTSADHLTCALERSKVKCADTTQVCVYIFFYKA